MTGYGLVLAGLPLGNILWDSFARSDGFGQGIVLLLLVGSVVAWSIMINKNAELSKVENADRRFMQDFARQGNALELFVHGREHENSPLAKIYQAACVATRREFETQARKQNRVLETIDLGEEHLTAAQIESIRKVAECQAADQMVLLESSMSFLGSIYTENPSAALRNMADDIEIPSALAPVHSYVLHDLTASREISYMADYSNYLAYLQGTQTPWRRIVSGASTGRKALVIADSYRLPQRRLRQEIGDRL